MPAHGGNRDLPRHLWIIRETDPERGRKYARKLARELGCSPLLARVLAARGIDSAEKAGRYLNPQDSDILPPESIPGLVQARDRLVRAVKERQSVLVHGDYDVDGIAGAVILHQALKDHGCASGIFLPTRQYHGFGLALEAVEKARKSKVDLIVSVDCGISSHDSIAAAQKAGIDIIVTDHHALPEVLPSGAILVHPDLDGDYPGGKIAGPTVALKLVLALLAALGEDSDEALAKYLPLAAVATVADVCPLADENRAIVSMGMPAIPLTRIPGLKVLYLGTHWGTADETIDARDIAFGMAPCLNAAGRMGNPLPAAKLLMAKDEDAAWKQFRELQGLNKRRKSTQNEVCRRLLSRPEVAWIDPGAGILAVADENCTPGLAGLAAVRLAEQTGRPTCILAPSEDPTGPLYRGSMRTSGGENLLELMEPALEFVENFGGHPGAVGVTVRPDSLAGFLDACGKIKFTPRRSELVIDLTMTEPPGDPDEIIDLDRTRPWGAGNAQPSFVWEPVTIENPRRVGREGDHVQVSIGGRDGSALKGIGFGMARWFGDGGPVGTPVRAAGHFILNDWQGSSRMEFQLTDIDMI